MQPLPPLADDFEDNCEINEDFEPDWIDMPKTAYNAVFLTFKDPSIEAAFTEEHNASLIRWDVIGYFLAFFASFCLLLGPGTHFDQPGFITGLQLWRWLVCYLPFIILITPSTRSFYRRYREPLLAYNFITSTLWYIHVRNYTTFETPDSFSEFTYRHGFACVALVVLFFQVRCRVLAPSLLACFVADACILPTMCAGYFPHGSTVGCVALCAFKWSLVVLVTPLGLVWLLEKRRRDDFKRKLNKE